MAAKAAEAVLPNRRQTTTVTSGLGYGRKGTAGDRVPRTWAEASEAAITSRLSSVSVRAPPGFGLHKPPRAPLGPVPLTIQAVGMCEPGDVDARHPHLRW